MTRIVKGVFISDCRQHQSSSWNSQAKVITSYEPGNKTFEMVRAAGIEPTTFGFGAERMAKITPACAPKTDNTTIAGQRNRTIGGRIRETKAVLGCQHPFKPVSQIVMCLSPSRLLRAGHFMSFIRYGTCGNGTDGSSSTAR